jgi:hypothetical protein
MLYNLFPKFKIVEINNVAALRMGHVIAQTPAKDSGVAVKEVGEYKFLENGVIVGYDADGSLKNFSAADHTQPCLIYTEELVTAGLLEGLDQFADQFVDGVVYPRALPLNLGDTFTTNNYAGTLGDGFGAVVNGIITIQESRSGAMFIVKKSDLPAGQDAIECTYIGYKA